MGGLEEQNKQLLLRSLLAERRSRELNRFKLKDAFSARTVMLCDNSNFSDFVGQVDEALFLSDVKMLGFPKNAAWHRELSTSKVSKIDCYTLNGEMVYVKTKRQSVRNNDLALTLLGYEAKVLEIVGNHDNINELIGMTFLHDDDIPCLVFRNLPQTSLKDRIDSLTGFLSLS